MSVHAKFVDARALTQRWPDLFPDAARVYQLAKANVLPCVRLGRRVFFDQAEVEAFLGRGGASLPGGWRRERPEAQSRG